MTALGSYRRVYVVHASGQLFRLNYLFEPEFDEAFQLTVELQ